MPPPQPPNTYDKQAQFNLSLPAHHFRPSRPAFGNFRKNKLQSFRVGKFPKGWKDTGKIGKIRKDMEINFF